eukprot:jgi/Mesen1/3875/ME000207S02884
MGSSDCTKAVKEDYKKPVVAGARPSRIQRTWSGSESSHTANIFEKPYVSLRDDYDVGPVIGEGQFGCVRTCTHKETGERYAVKVICKSSLKSSLAVDTVRDEISLMQAVGEHRGVVGLHDVLEDSKYVCILLELCMGGDLFDRITARKHYPESEAAEVCASIAEVLRHCRSRGVMHRDLKPENILLCNKHSHTKIRVADFGAGAFVNPGEKLTALAGSAYYVAPEVVNGSYGAEADVWSMGVCLYILLCGMPPFWAKDEEGVMEAIKAGKVDMSWGPWTKISKGAKDLVLCMLTLDPSQRISPDEILEHAWVTKYVKPLRIQVARPLAAHSRVWSCSSLHGASLPSSSLMSTSPTAAAFLACSPRGGSDRRLSKPSLVGRLKTSFMGIVA